MRSRNLPLPQPSRQIPWWTGVLAGILAVVIGVLLILSPKTTATYLFWILGAATFAGGAVALVSIPFRRASWGWKLLAGILAIILGLALFSQPLFSAYLVAAMALWILGVLIIIAGAALVIAAFSGLGWWYGILGGLAMAVGALVILGSVIGPQKAPWIFGLTFIVGGIPAIVMGVRSRRPA
jgi:uncharacterized membrane protein HdeD (DUF308 family)